MPFYEATFTATVRIEATNAAAAKAVLAHKGVGHLRLIGAEAAVKSAPSKKGSVWTWVVEIKDQAFGALRRVT